MKVNILNTQYDIQYSNRNKDSLLKKADGYCDFTSKKIVIDEMEEIEGMQDLTQYRNKVTRHELLHAFLYESGLMQYSQDELLVDLLAIQFYKIQNIFEKLGVE